jgi:phosphoserine phosphatase RsbU-like protein
MSDSGFPHRYRRSLRAFVDDRSERRLKAAYELGRAAVQSGLGVLDVAAEHTRALLAIAESRPASEATGIIEAAGDFLVEALAAFEMVQRGADEARLAAFRERRRARMLHELSSLFADASVAASAPEAAAEVAQLVAEITREATDAARARVVLRAGWRAGDIEARAEELEPAGSAPTETLTEPLQALDGRSVGFLEIEAAADAVGSDDRETIRHVAQLTAAWLERAGRQHAT